MKSAHRIDERIVVQAWERQAFDAAAWDGLGLSVIFRGMPSDAGGPDYQNALLARRQSAVLSGDVEFHVRTSDWYRHGHHRDRHYNFVILHVVWTDDIGVTEREDGETVPILALQPYVSVDELRRESCRAARLLPHPCIRSFRSLETGDLLGHLRDLGMLRFDERAARFGADLTARDADQIAFGALLEALGYASNREAFRQLAEIVPYAWLASLPSDLQVDALLGAAGLAVVDTISLPARLPEGSWRLARIRPANHPGTRLRGIVVLLKALGPRLADALVHAVERAQRPADLRRVLLAQTDSRAFIGPGRADEIAVSVVLPLVEAIGPSSPAAKRLFAEYPSPPSNRWTRTMEEMFAEAGHRIIRRSAAVHQGMHHLYHTNCRFERFLGCAVCEGIPLHTSESAQADSRRADMSYQSRPILTSTSRGTSNSTG